MKDFNELTPSEMLTLLLDGELSQEQEAVLFSHMAGDTELQSELRELLAIRESVRSDTEAFTPPVDTTSKLFDRLGYAPPASVGAGLQSASGSTPRWKSIFRNSAFIALIAILAIMVSTFVIYESQKNDASANNTADNMIDKKSADNKSDKKSANSSKNLYEDDAQNNESASTPVSYSKENTYENQVYNKNVAQNITNNSDNKQPRKSDFVKNNQNINSNNNPLNIIDEDENTSYSENIPKPKYYDNININHNRPHYSSAFSNNFSDLSRANFAQSDILLNPHKMNMSISRTDKYRGNISLHLSGIYAISAPENDMQFTSGSPAFQNIVGGLFVNWNRNLSLGIEFGQEPFDQIYLNDPTEQYNHSPNVFWLGIFPRYDFHQISFKNVHPYVQVGVAGSELGPLVKGNVGMQFLFPGEHFGISASYGYSNLFYENKGVSYNTNKYGLMFGISYHF